MKALSSVLNQHKMVLVIFGPSGSGKTTLLKSIADDLNKKSKKVGFMPQNYSLCEDLTVLENLKFFSSIYKLDLKDLWKKIEALLKVFEIFETLE